MTTIAYNHKDKEIAVDSREVSGNLICSDDVDKAILKNNQPFFLCGDNEDMEELISLYFGEIKVTKNNDAYGYTIKDGKAYELYAKNDNGKLSVMELTYSQACGSGSNFALSAIDFGHSAEEAVEYAKTRDCKTGGEVHVFKVE